MNPAEVTVPSPSDIRVVNQRRRLKRGRASLDVDEEETEERRKKPSKDKVPEPMLKSGL